MNDTGKARENGASGENGENIPHQTLEVEIINPDGSREKVNPGAGRSWRARGGNFSYGTVWNYAPMDNSGCVAGLISCFIFLVCLGQYGALAAIGFLVFHFIGSIVGTFIFARRLMRGLAVNVWPIRVANWIISFALVAFLAGNN